MVFWCVLALSVAADGRAEMLHRQAVELYDKGQFKKAAGVLGKELYLLPPEALGSEREQKLREMLVLSLYQSGSKDEAGSAYRQLRERFPDFRFDPDRVLPDTIAYFDALAPPPAPKVVASAPPPASAPVDRPTQLVVAPPPPPPQPHWHWYYLAPLGIGQFAAHSPVRGSLLLVTELGFIAANVAGAVLFFNQRRNDGFFTSAPRAQTAQIVMDVGFFGLISALAVGVIDGALERD